MKVAFCADVHLGNHKTAGGPVVAGINTRCKQTLEALGRALGAAASAGAEVFVILGDLYDGCKPEPQLISAVQALFTFYKRKFGLKVVALLGNHDMRSNADGDHALGPIGDYAFVASAPLNLKVIEDTELLLVPFHPSPAGQWFDKVVRYLAGVSKTRTKILCLHLGIADDETPEWLVGAPDSIQVDALTKLCSECGIVAAFAGNWHEHMTWEGPFPTVVQLGALVPTGWDNPGLDGYGRIALMDAESLDITFIEIPGPRFYKASSVPDLERTVKANIGSRNSIYYRARVAPEDVARVKAVADEFRNGNVFACDAEVDVTEARASARQAAGAARSADTLVEALGAFVAEMPLKESGLDRQDILARCQKYLGVGGGAAK